MNGLLHLFRVPNFHQGLVDAAKPGGFAAKSGLTKKLAPDRSMGLGLSTLMSESLSGQFPEMFRIRQAFPQSPVVAIPGLVRSGMTAMHGSIWPGMKIAVGVGSRGISNLSEIVAAVVMELREAGAEPFIVPAMGSHGGATSEGQAGLLANYGITDQSMGVPICAGMEVECLGRTGEGMEVLFSREALQADAIVPINRIKPHTTFSGAIGSGLCKMLVVGFGKHAGALEFHGAGLSLGFESIIRSVSDVILEKAPILCGVAVLEDACHQTASVEVIPARELVEREADLLAEASRLMPGLPFQEIDLLIVDQIGKNISGSGMDTNIICRNVNGYCGSPAESGDKPFIWRIFVRGLTPETHGNALGIGIADATTTRLVRSINHQSMRTNALTSRSVQCAKLPMDFETDSEAIQAMLVSLSDPDPSKARVVRIRDTLSLGTMEVSDALAGTIRTDTTLEPLGQVEPMRFDEDGNLRSLELA